MSKKLAIWGASNHALVVADIVRLLGDYEIVGFLDSVNPERARSALMRCPNAALMASSDGRSPNSADSFVVRALAQPCVGVMGMMEILR